MPAACRTTVAEPRSTAPYSVSELQLTAMTVAALKLYLKHFKLSTTRKKSKLVGCLHSHLHAPQITDTSNLQPDASPQDAPVNA